MKFSGYDPAPVAMYGQLVNVGLPTVLNEPGRIVRRRGVNLAVGLPIPSTVGLPTPSTILGVAEKTGENVTYLGVPTLTYPSCCIYVRILAVLPSEPGRITLA